MRARNCLAEALDPHYPIPACATKRASRPCNDRVAARFAIAVATDDVDGRERQTQYRAASQDGAGRRGRRVPKGGSRSRPGAGRRGAGAAGVRARRHHEPAADLGSRPVDPGRNVRDHGGSGRARCPTRLFSRPFRMPRLAFRLGRAGARRADVEDRLPRRPHADRQGAASRARRDPNSARRRADLHRRRDGGKDRRSRRRRRRTGAFGRQGVYVSGGLQLSRAMRLSRDRAPHRRRIRRL